MPKALLNKHLKLKMQRKQKSLAATQAKGKIVQTIPQKHLVTLCDLSMLFNVHVETVEMHFS